MILGTNFHRSYTVRYNLAPTSAAVISIGKTHSARILWWNK